MKHHHIRYEDKHNIIDLCCRGENLDQVQLKAMGVLEASGLRYVEIHHGDSEGTEVVQTIARMILNESSN